MFTRLAAVCVLCAEAVFAQLQLEAPFQSKEFSIYGDASKLSKEIVLAGRPRERGAVWTSDKIAFPDFTLEAVIRSQADLKTEVGKSGFTLWYTENPNPLGDVHGGRDMWDGLAVMVDSLGSRELGAVRGHLNDGTTKFLGLEDVEDAALSLCQIAYRNAAGPIRVRVGYSRVDGFAVDVNGQKCFISTDIELPPGYFGVSANSDISGDKLSLVSMQVMEGMHPEVRAHLPSNPDEPVKSEEAVVKQRSRESQGSAQQQAYAPAPKVDLSPIVDRLAKIEQQLELLDNRILQNKQVIDQLVDTMSFSLEQSSTDAIARDTKALRAAVGELQSRDKGPQTNQQPRQAESRPFRDTLLLAILLPIPTVAALAVYLGVQRKQHEKLL